MCTWNDTGIEFLYTHDGKPGAVFFYTREDKPSSLLDGFRKQSFFLLFTGWQIDEKEELKKLQERLGIFAKKKSEKAIIWIFNQMLPMENWEWIPLKTGSGESSILSGGIEFLIGGYTFELTSGTHLIVEQREDGEQIVFSNRDSYAAAFFYDGAAAFLMERCILWMEGEKAGCFSVVLSENTTLAALHAGICYSMQTEEAVHGKRISTFFDTAIEPDKELVTLKGSLDVLRICDTKRSFFRLPEGTWRTAFPIYLSFENLLLQSEEECIKLVFAKRRIQASSEAFRYYLTFDGFFTIVSGDGSLFLGKNGQEYVNFKKGRRFYFVSGQRGYFPLKGTENIEKPSTGDTAYVAIEDGIYYSQAQESAFYEADGMGTVRNYAQIPFCSLRRETCFPILPLGDFGRREGEDIRDLLDERFLAERRNRLLSEEKAERIAFAQERSVLSTKGLYGVIGSTGDFFERLEFSEKFRFGKVGGLLKQALFASYAFLVIDNAEEFSKYASVLPEETPFGIGGWTFHMEPEIWEKNGTFLILKYTSHKSIRELAKAPGEWSYPAAKDNLREHARCTLSAFLEGLANEKDNPVFANLLHILEDPSWCGAIACSVPVDGSGLPKHLRFLLRTRGDRALTAHHLIFNKRLMDEEGRLSAGEISGILYYEDTEHPILEKAYDFYYKLDMLRVVFEQSRITDFACRISLTLQYFLGMPLYVANGLYGNYMILTGSMAENKDSDGVMDCSFSLENPVEYLAGNAPLSGILVEKVKLVSSYREEDISFFLSGRLKFEKWDVDILSFGDSDDGEDCTLSFSDLLLLVEKEKLIVHTGTMKFQNKNSHPRNGSLAKQFPIALQGFVTGTGTEELDALGYEGIQVDGIRQKELSGPFTGVCFRVNLGGLGALSSVGDLGMLLLVAWSAGEVYKDGEGGVTTEKAACYLGAKIGNFRGTGGILTLEGILDMSLDSIELKHTEKGAFYLYLRNFSLRFLNHSFLTGSNDIYVFADEKGEGELGWYAAYEQKGEEHVY